mgnify:CR=1 FL=1
MKLFTLLFIAITLLPVLLCGQDQADRPASNAGMNLDQAFQKVEKAFKVHLAYNPEFCHRFELRALKEKKSATETIEAILADLPFKLSQQDESHFLIVYDEDKLRRLEAAKPIRTPVEMSGRIEDMYTHEPITGALLVLMPDGITAETDTSGKFILQCISKHENPWLEIRYIGYQTQVLAQASKTRHSLYLKLFPEISELPPVTISSVRPNLNMERINSTISHYATSFEYRIQSNPFRDVIRYVQQTTAGINATDDRSTGIQIRGSNADENLIRLNGLTLFNIDHFYGVFTSINPYIISSIDLYKSYFPAQFGGRTSSVIQMKSPEEITGWHGGVDLNLITANAYLHAPVSDKINLVAGARTTTFNLGNSGTFSSLLQNKNSTIDPLKLTDTTELTAINPDYRFNDQFAKLDIRPFSKMKLSTSYFGSYDIIESGYYNTELLSQVREGDYKEKSEWTTQAFNVSLHYDWSKQFSSELSMARSTFDFGQSILSRVRLRTIVVNENSNVSNRFINRNYRLDNKFVYNNIVFNFGAELNNNDSRAISSFNQFNFTLDTAIRNEIAGYVQADYRVLSRLTLSPGLRISHYGSESNADFSPRFAAVMQWNAAHQTSLHYGRYYQYARQSRYEDRFGREYYLWVQSDGRKYPTLISDQYEIIQALSAHRHTFKTEFYYKAVQGVVENLAIIQTPPPGNNEPLKVRNEFLVGKGRYYGVDITYEYHTKIYQAYLIYSYNLSENSFPPLDAGKYYRKAYARQHQVKTSQQFHYDRWDFSLNAVYGSPQPYNDIVSFGSQSRDRRPRQETRYLDDYFRVDGDLRYTLSFRKSRLEFSFSVLNIFDRRNTKYVQSLFTFTDQNNASSKSKKYVVGAEVETLRRTLNAGIGFHF